MNIVDSIVEEFSLEPNSYYEQEADPHARRRMEIRSIIDNWPYKGYPSEADLLPNEYVSLKMKWASSLDSHGEGILLDPPCPTSWYQAIDSFFDYVSSQFPRFKISSAKISNGGVRINLKYVSKDILEESNRLCTFLFDKQLAK